MTHIAFITLFLGLTLGPQRMAFQVTGPAHHVELQMDGRLIAVMGREPWVTNVDLGHHLLPHRLVARAMDIEGHELARAEQTLNVPRSSAEVQMILDRDAAGAPSSVQVLWQSLEADKPRNVRVTLDGKPLALDQKMRAEIPKIDVSRPHLLEARAVAQDRSVTQTEVAFGGGLETSSGRQLSAVAIRVRNGKTPSTAELEQWLLARGEPARVVAIEELPAEVIAVRHPFNAEAAMRLDMARVLARFHIPEVSDQAMVHHPRPLVRLIWPVPNRTSASIPTDLMPYTNAFEFTTADTFRAVIANIGYGRNDNRMRYADAVAVAGLRGMGTRRPRAVVLVLGVNVHDESQLKPAQVREYLRSIGVPLFVWALSGVDEIRDWGEPVDASNPRLFERAFAALKESLQSQRIVWLDGDYLPAEVTVAEAGRDAVEVISTP